MAHSAQQQLLKYLSEAHGMERQALVLLSRGADIIGDAEVASIFRTHERQTHEHARRLVERLEAHGQSPSKVKDAVMRAGAAGLGMVVQAAPDTPIRLATTTFAFENLEIAAYRLIGELARRAGDSETASVVADILEEEEAAAQLIAAAFPRIVDLALAEAPTSPVPDVTRTGS